MQSNIPTLLPCSYKGIFILIRCGRQKTRLGTWTRLLWTSIIIQQLTVAWMSWIKPKWWLFRKKIYKQNTNTLHTRHYRQNFRTGWNNPDNRVSIGTPERKVRDFSQSLKVVLWARSGHAHSATEVNPDEDGRVDTKRAGTVGVLGTKSDSRGMKVWLSMIHINFRHK